MTNGTGRLVVAATSDSPIFGTTNARVPGRITAAIPGRLKAGLGLLVPPMGVRILPREHLAGSILGAYMAYWPTMAPEAHPLIFR